MQTKLIHLGLDLVFQFVVQLAAAYEPQDAVRALLVDFGEDIDQECMVLLREEPSHMSKHKGVWVGDAEFGTHLRGKG